MGWYPPVDIDVDTDVDTGVTKGDRNQCLDFVETQLGSFADTKNPRWYEVKDTGGHLDSRNSPRIGKNIKCFLIINVVRNIE